MIAILVIASVIGDCFVIINSQSTVADETETSSQCIWNIEEYMRRSFERTFRRNQQMLMQVKSSIDNMSAQLMTIRCSQSTTTDRHGDQKQHLVSALTGKFALLCLFLLS